MNDRLTEPFFSIILPVYNGQAYLGKAIQSVLEQTFRSWELIAIDDASSDSSAQIVQAYTDSDPRIQLIRNEQSLRSGPSSNRGIQKSRGQWIMRLDHDDAFRPGYLQRVFDHTKGQVGMDQFLSVWVSIINGEGDRLLDATLPDAKTVQRMLGYENVLYHSATSFPKVLWEKVGGYSETSQKNDDIILWKKFTAVGARLRILPEVLVHYRIHMESMTSRFESGLRREDGGIVPRMIRQNKEWKASLYLKNGHLREAREELRALYREGLRPTVKNRFYYLLTYLPSSTVRFFMWRLRPYLRTWLRKRATS